MDTLNNTSYFVPEEMDESYFQVPHGFINPEPISDAPVNPESTVAEAAKVVPIEQPARLVDNFSNSDKLSDQALFDELNNVSEEVMKCRDQVLSKIS